MALPDIQSPAGLQFGGPEGGGTPEAEDVEVSLESLGQWQLAWRRFKLHRLATVGLVIFGFMVALAILGPIIDPYDPLFIPNAHQPGGRRAVAGPPVRHRRCRPGRAVDGHQRRPDLGCDRGLLDADRGRASGS